MATRKPFVVNTTDCAFVVDDVLLEPGETTKVSLSPGIAELAASGSLCGAEEPDEKQLAASTPDADPTDPTDPDAQNVGEEG